MRRAFLLAAFAALLSPLASAQFGKVLSGYMDLETLTGNNGLLGVECGPGADPANPGTIVQDYLWVTGRKVGTDVNHWLYQFDPYANPVKLVAKYQVPAVVAGSAWGLRDLAYDITTNVIYGGTDSTVSRALFGFDAKALKWDPTRDIQTATSLGVLRAVALDPFKKLFYLADFTSNIEIIDFNGIVTGAYTSNQHGAVSIYGLAYVYLGPHVGTLWSFGQGGSVATTLPGSRVVLKQHDLTRNAAFTGLMTFSDTTLPYTGGTYPDGGIAGGLGYSMDKVYQQPVFWCLQQNTLDGAAAIDPTWTYGKGCPGSSKLVPGPGMDGDAPYVSNTAWKLKVSDIAGASAAFLWLGASSKSWSGIPLPLDLSFLGMFGCSVNSSWDFLLGSAVVTAGEASLGVPIPNNTALRGADLYFQWLISDIVPSAVPLTTSPACGVRLK
ncbi:MAG: hypothetical protein JW990_19055 [Thermoleophilia bacterium]|nr:hypothetical protein [Thermoleophilia bacterium]